MQRLKNIPPREVLMEEFLLPLNITAYRLSKDIDIPQTRYQKLSKATEELQQTQH